MSNRRRKHKRGLGVPRHSVQVGALPGAFSLDPEAPPPVLRLIAYGPSDYVEITLADEKEIEPYVGKWPVIWVDVEGLGNEGILRALADRFGLHALALEDVVHVHQQPKAELYGERVFLVTRMAEMVEDVSTEQVSFFLGTHFVLTFQQGAPGDSFERVRRHIRTGAGALRGSGADFLFYSLIDAVVDHYFPVLERLGDRLEDLESEALSRPSLETVSRVHAIKRELLAFRRITWPMREALQSLLREPVSALSPETKIYLRDCHDHLMQIMDLIETYRELAAGLTDLYLSSSSNRMNEVMKVLTIIATIFMPLSFLVGLYGMNFDSTISPWNMPEIHMYWGYPILWLVMLLVAAGMVCYFWHKGWLKPTLPPSEAREDDASQDLES